MILKSVLLAQLSIGLVLALAVEVHAADRSPNIVFIFADDQAYDTLGTDGDPLVETPHLDSLVRRGTQFTHCYNMGSWTGAVCVASRTMLITGRTLWRARAADTQLRALRRGKLKPSQSTSPPLWPQRMRRLGYRTYFTGKWHVQARTMDLFDHVKHERPGMPSDTRKPPFHEEGYHRPLEGQPDPWSPFDRKFGGFWEGGRHWSEVLADDAVAFLKDAARRAHAQHDKAKPFFMYLSFNAPHDPRQSPKEFIDRYPLERIKLPEPFYARHPHDTAGLTPTRRDESLAPYPRTPYAVKVHRREYYALISHMDRQIGRILDALEQQKLKRDTWIIFTADHGLSCGHHGLMGKQNMFDHSVRVPFVIVGPGVRPQARIEEPIYVQDLMATCLDLAGDSRREGVEFQSLLPLLRGGKSRHTSIYGAFMDTQRMVRQDGWKLILYPELDVQLLFNLNDDPQERHNVASEPQYAVRKRSLLAELHRWQQALDDKLEINPAAP